MIHVYVDIISIEQAERKVHSDLWRVCGGGGSQALDSQLLSLQAPQGGTNGEGVHMGAVGASSSKGLD